MTAAEALRQLLAAAKLITADECKNPLVWNTLGGAIGVAEMVLRDGEKQEPVAYIRPAGLDNLKAGRTAVVYPCYTDSERSFCLYAAPAPAQPVVALPEDFVLVPKISTSAMDRAAEDAYDSNGHCDCGNPRGVNMETVYAAMLAAAPQPASVSAAPSGEVERAAILEEAAKLCDFQATWAKGEADDEENSVRYRHENRERQTAAELCAASIRAAATKE